MEEKKTETLGIENEKYEWFAGILGVRLRIAILKSGRLTPVPGVAAKKQIKKSLEDYTRSVAELEILRKIDHPNIVKFEGKNRAHYADESSREEKWHKIEHGRYMVTMWFR